MTAPSVTVSGHFGEWLQGCLGPGGPVVLVTMACAALRADFRPDRVARAGVPAAFSQDQLDAFAARLGVSLPTGLVALNFALGAGAGGSTATLVAWARAAGFTGSEQALAAACVATEGASDPLMYPHPDRLLWAPRAGRVIRALAPPPPCAVLGGFWGAPERTDPEDRRFADVGDLVADWEAAVAARDLGRAAAVAAASAQACGARGAGLTPAPDPTPNLARDLGALGWVRAHTGSARGLIFAPGTLPSTGAQALSEAGLTDVLSFATGAA